MDDTVRRDRRAVLQGAALLPAAALLHAAASREAGAADASQPTAQPPNRADDLRVPADPASGESLALARHVAQTRLEDIPAAALRMSRLSILDALGVSMAASGEEPAVRPFLEQAFEGGAGGESVVLGTGRRSTAMLAALANGALAHALDYEDAHDPSRTHPNAAPVAAAVALASAPSSVGAPPAISGKAFLEGGGTGLRCHLPHLDGTGQCRRAAAGVLSARHRRHFRRHRHGVETAGPFGRADAERILDRAVPERLQRRDPLRCLFRPARGARRVLGPGRRAGPRSWRARGVKGFSRPFEGERGFYAMVSDGRHVPGLLTRELGTRFEGQFVGYKGWPACRDAHPYIQAVLEGMARDRLDSAQIESIHAWVPQRSLIICEPRAEKRRPRAAIDAKFSLYFTVATALRHGRVDFGSFAPDALRDGATLALADRVDYTVGNGPALLEVQLRGGRRVGWRIDALYGSPENPMSEAALVAKFIDCGKVAMRPVDGATLRQVAQDVLAIERVPEMRALLLNL